MARRSQTPPAPVTEDITNLLDRDEATEAAAGLAIGPLTFTRTDDGNDRLPWKYEFRTRVEVVADGALSWTVLLSAFDDQDLPIGYPHRAEVIREHHPGQAFASDYWHQERDEPAPARVLVSVKREAPPEPFVDPLAPPTPAPLPSEVACALPAVVVHSADAFIYPTQYDGTTEVRFSLCARAEGDVFDPRDRTTWDFPRPSDLPPLLLTVYCLDEAGEVAGVVATNMFPAGGGTSMGSVWFRLQSGQPCARVVARLEAPDE